MVEQSDFRKHLNDELLSRIQKNPAYSLRAYARSLGIDSSALSKLLKGHRSISPSMLRNMGLKLGLSPSKLRHFERGVTETRGRKNEISPRPALRQNLVPFKNISEDTFCVISDWYHFAILELIATENFVPRAKWVAKTLSISVTEVNQAVERLMSIGYLKIDASGKWHDLSGEVSTVGNEYTTAAFRLLQKQILSKAIIALEELPFEQRDHSGLTMAIDTSLLPKAKQKIKEFRRELCSFLQSSKHKDAVFHMGLALYPVTKMKQEKV